LLWPLLFADHAAEELANGAHGQRLVAEDDAGGLLHRADPVAAPGDQLLLGSVGALPQHDHGAWRLAPLGVRDAHDRDLTHGRVVGDGVLQLRGPDVEAAGDDHVLLAVGEEEVAALVQVADVAGEDEAVAGEPLRGRLRVAQDLFHVAGGVDGDLAPLAGWQLAAVVAEDPDHRPRGRAAGAAQQRGVVLEAAGDLVWGEDRAGDPFALPVAEVEHVAEGRADVADGAVASGPAAR
jgi:hypothetical protein